MAVEVPTLYEPRRGCGRRKPGGLYLVADGPMEACGKLPIELGVCPTCGEGIAPSRGWTWVEGDPLCKPGPHGDRPHRLGCPLARPLGRCGLLWIGEQFYKTPAAFSAEARALGVSRRIAAVPRDFEPGRTLVLVAHRKAISVACRECGDAVVRDCSACAGQGFAFSHGVFSAFRPSRVEYVVSGKESEEELERLAGRGIRPVRVEPVESELGL